MLQRRPSKLDPGITEERQVSAIVRTSDRRSSDVHIGTAEKYPKRNWLRFRGGAPLANIKKLLVSIRTGEATFRADPVEYVRPVKERSHLYAPIPVLLCGIPR